MCLEVSYIRNMLPVPTTFLLTLYTLIKRLIFIILSATCDFHRSSFIKIKNQISINIVIYQWSTLCTTSDHSSKFCMTTFAFLTYCMLQCSLKTKVMQSSTFLFFCFLQKCSWSKWNVVWKLSKIQRDCPAEELLIIHPDENNIYNTNLIRYSR